MSTVPRVLSIAGTDPTGGAGIQADLKSIAANGGYGMAVVTALVAQNTQGVRSVHVPPTQFLEEQLNAVSADVVIDAVKIGMLANTEVIEVVTAWLNRVSPQIVVLDPVMVATSGDRLLDRDAEQALRQLASRADLLTPNIPELAILAEEPIGSDWTAVIGQAKRVAARLGVRILAKGGHLGGEKLPDALVDPHGQVVEFSGERIATTNTHGTGCSLSSAIATRYAATGDWVSATGESKRWLTESIRHGASLEVGAGHGPVSHFAGLWERGGTSTRPTPADVIADWWEYIRDLRENIDELPFVRALGDGTLDQVAFVWYLQQDALYLHDYSRALAEASRLAPTGDEQAFWAASAHGAVATEMQLHESWIPADALGETYPSAVTSGYLNHLLATSARGDYAVLIAALLPCFWLYQDVGTRLHPLSHADHRYRTWLDTYADDAFAAATQRAVMVVATAAAHADDTTRVRMREAFRASAAHELAFFAAPHDMLG
ncbi:hydroxymethylpyrimidine kinase/phosphomethylpyrimidine kinase [Microbacterium halimionae]|uniref:Hydroxymethylpyrimidine kinase/phosphomethylpyrimidine kinase n=1 Tax=Microbacterium halimionae TaxID=1526413 RepID=A0A7W3JNZ9_9MICO|nr:bifunctional hydroxymethylpyrimidine kinase/phosphomethylpyrimidine kinase [Microbacterium halimionae]MBA8816366.1 hydroxymethylpyrimidine kinase/phosphomethylpyrimidine kinase [Microbacterium halimionae]NII96568.1 hydroxymethylpyrimidine kinase/phosphomethylpyrimidine kinase [Microbacterium halimionae]